MQFSHDDVSKKQNGESSAYIQDLEDLFLWFLKPEARFMMRHVIVPTYMWEFLFSLEVAQSSALGKVLRKRPILISSSPAAYLMRKILVETMNETNQSAH